MEEFIIDNNSTRNMEELKEEEKERIRQRLQTLDYMDSTSIIKFGLENNSKVSILFFRMISTFKMEEFEQAKNIISELFDIIKSIHIKELIKLEDKNPLNVFHLKERKQKKIALDLLSIKINIEKIIERLEDKLMEVKFSLITDIEFCKRMLHETYKSVSEQELDCIAVQEAINIASNQLIEVEQLKKENSDNPEYSTKITNIRNAIKRLRIKATNQLAFRTSIIQSIAKIKLVQSKDELMIYKIDNIITNVIPAWKRNFLMVLFVENPKEQRPVIDEKTLKDVNNHFEQMFKALEEINEQSMQARTEMTNFINNIDTQRLTL